MTTSNLLTQYDNEAIESRVGCVAAAMQVIGNKWTALILKELAGSPRRFSYLQKAVEGLNPRTLSQRLNDLESHGILSRESFAEMPPRTEYRLTAKGEDLIPVLRQMAAWGDKYYEAGC